MSRISTGTVVILAAICFTGLVALQLAWIQSAYKGELALYNKEKRQFESALQMHLSKDEGFKTGMKKVLDNYTNQKMLSLAEQNWLTENLRTAIRIISKEKEYSIHPLDFRIGRHMHGDSARTLAAPILLSKNEAISEKQIEKAGKLCLHCILGLNIEDQYNFQVLVFYEKEHPVIYKKMGVLIAASFLLLLFLGLLFRQMLKKHQQEKKLSEAKNDFINNLSHELQTPVFAVQMANRIIKEKTVDRPELRPLTEIIEKETLQLKEHARKILELASLENEQVELNMEDIELTSFVEAKLPTLQLMLQTKDGEVKFYRSAGPLFVRLDSVHFNNVLVSLAENALKYNNGRPILELGVGENDNKIYLKLTDNGIGISQQYLPYVFDKFYRVPEVKRNGTTGFGLGLSYVRQIINLHEGQINIKSEPGKGTIINILLPKPIQHV